MQHKKSINAKDIFLCKENEKQKNNNNNNSNANCTEVSKQCYQHQQSFQKQKQNKSKIQQSFLFSIRASRGKNRYKLQNSHEQLEKPIKSVDITTDSAMKLHVQGKRNMERSQNYCRATNFSPFNNYKGEVTKQDIIENSSQIFNNPQISNKIRIKVIKQRIQSKSLGFKCRSQKSRTTTNKVYAKMMEFKTEFSKTKILEKDSLDISRSQQKLNPYQLSIRRKNIRLLKVKLNSLGQRVDEKDKEKLIQFSKFCEQDNKFRKLAHKQIPKQLKQKGQKSMFQSLQISKRKQEKWEILNLQSKTIQIRKIPKTARNSVERKRFATNYAENKQKQDN